MRLSSGFFMAFVAANVACHKPRPVEPLRSTSVSYAHAADDLHILDRMVTVGTLQLHLHCEGEGEPVVVLESGLGLDYTAWREVQPSVARSTRACAYDRAGRGRSTSPPPYPHGQRQMAEELHALLKNAEQRGPYVLVGHSMGGAIARWFHADHPAEVAGMVLIDAAGDEWMKRNLALAPPEAMPEFRKNLREWEGLDEETLMAGYADLRADEPSLGSKPLVVLTAGKPAGELQARRDAQSVPGLSSNAVYRVAAQSGHNVPLEQPAEVIRAIRSVVESVRTATPLGQPAPTDHEP